MKISMIEVENFKQFYGCQRAVISTSDSLNVTVFHGTNGAGKTSLFTAINWCLYGVGHEGMGELLNKQVIKETKIGNALQLRVCVQFIHETHKFIAERLEEFIKINEEQGVRPSTPEFNLYYIDSKGQTIKVPNPEGKMDSILSKNVREYFFFNGEKMEDLTRTGNQLIQDAIKNIMNLPIIDRAVNHLEQATKDYRSEVARIGAGRIDQLIQLQNELEDERKRLQKTIAESEKEIISANAYIQDLEQKLNDNKEVGQLQQRRKNIQEDIRNAEVKRDQLENRLQKAANECFSYLASNSAKKTLDLIAEQVGKGKIPRGIGDHFVKELLSQKLCICKRPLPEGSPEYKALLELVQSNTRTDYEDKILILRGQLQTLSRVTSNNLENLKENLLDYNSTLDLINAKRREEDELTRRIGNADEVDIANLERTRQNYNSEVVKIRVSITRNQDRLKLNEKDIQDTKLKRENEEKKEDALLRIRTREKLSEQATEAMREIKNKFYEATRSRVEEETKLVFSKLAWKNDQFNDIKLDKEFRLEVLDRWNTPSREELSAGERQMLSLAFISALSRLSGEESPVIMDTPFARLSGNHLKTTTSNLPILLPQLILLVTDTEWTEEVAEGLKSKVGKHYTFDFISGCTTIREDKNG